MTYGCKVVAMEIRMIIRAINTKVRFIIHPSDLQMTTIDGLIIVMFINKSVGFPLLSR